MNSSVRENARRSRLVSAASAVVERLETRQLLSAVNVTDFRYNIGSSGVNSNEAQLTPANVKVGSFGKISTTPVDGNIYAEPLVVNGVPIAAGVNTKAGAAGVHDVVFVATENGNIYAIDTHSGAVLWERVMVSTTNTGGNINNTLGATASNSVLDQDVGLPHTTGVFWDLTGTPVIDDTTHILYVVVRTKETINGATHFVQRLHALKLGDGTDAATPFMIGDTTGAYINNTPIYVYGTGDGATADSYNGTGKTVIQFNARRELQRPALNLVNHNVYVAWASNGDNGPYHGFIASWDVSQITTAGFKLSGVLCTSPNEDEAGIWEGGGALAFESDGSAFYALTSNGSGGAPTLGANGLPTNANYNEALIKVVPDPASTAAHENPNGWGMKVTDFFIPYNVVALDGADSDFGSGGPLILPDSAGITGHPHLIAAGGKDGRIFILDRDHLGGYHSNSDSALNSVTNPSGNKTPPNVIAGTLSTPAYYNGKLYIVGGYLGNAKAFTIGPTGALTISSSTSNPTFGGLPGGPTISSNGANNGIVWMVDIHANALRAYSAASYATELWDSTQAPSGRDSLGAAIKLSEPTVANGEVFVSTQNSLVIYGLTPPSGAVPVKPVLSANAVSGSSINLTWTDGTVAPNTATGYLIEDSTDNKTFTQITTAPAGATSISIGGLDEQTTYYFRIRGFNAVGNSGYSNTANAMTTTGGSSTGVSPNAPTGLGASPLSATSIFLTWTANSSNQTGYHLDRALDPNFTQSLITENLPGSPASYTDTAIGLASGLTFYYRLRAFNSAGDSGNSNTAPTTISTAPPKPSNQSITNITTNEIGMQWQDNAGHLADGYLIIRAENHGTFSTVATLPPTSRPAPSVYTWADMTVTPGNYYEYHIEAYNVAGNNDFAGVNATSITNAPAAPTATVSSAGINLTWAAVAGAATYNVYRGTSAGGESATPIATGLTSPKFLDATVKAGTKYYYTVSAVNANAAYTPPLPSESAHSKETSATASTTVTNPAHSGKLTTAVTIGAALHGSASLANGVYTVNGSGGEIFQKNDQFEYEYGAVNGDTTIIAKVTSVSNTNAWAKSGVMIRDGLATNSSFADVVVTPAGHVAFQWRSASGAMASTTIVSGTHTVPQWVKVVRTGNSFTGFYSTNGTTWVQIGTAHTLTMSTAATAGLAVCSLNPTLLCKATFSNVSITTH